MKQEQDTKEFEWISPPFEPEINLFGLSIKLTAEGWINKDKPEVHEEGKNG